MQPLESCIGPTIRIGREILCLPNVGFLKPFIITPFTRVQIIRLNKLWCELNRFPMSVPHTVSILLVIQKLLNFASSITMNWTALHCTELNCTVKNFFINGPNVWMKWSGYICCPCGIQENVSSSLDPKYISVFSYWAHKKGLASLVTTPSCANFTHLPNLPLYHQTTH